MKLKLLMTLFLVTSIIFNSKAEEYPPTITISGDNTTCTGEVYSYSVIYDPAVFYEWTITNGTFITSPTGSNQVDVAWYASGSITANTYSDPGLTTLINTDMMSVTVDVLDPYITMDPEVGCLDERREQKNSNPDKEEDDCHKACEDNPISYFSNGNAGSTFTWQVVGDANIILNTSNELRVIWQSVGFGVVILTETSANGCVEETEICVEIIPKPLALFDVIPGLTVCVGQTVFFEDLSQAIGNSDLTAWEWSVSDGTFQAYTESTDFSHVFNTGGSFSVNLRVYNNCGCYDDYKVKIKVIGEPGPEIFCPKVVCPNEKTVIYTNSSCGIYNWSVDNGTIVSGLGTSSITVMWDDDPSGVGYVYLSTPCGACPIPSVLQIPIVSTSLDIEGPIQVCQGDQVTLTAPLIPGTFYDWNVYSTPTSAFIIQEIHNQVIVEVLGTVPVTVEVIYYNELAGCGEGCGGEATHTMIAVAPSSIDGEENVCVGDIEPYWIIGPASGNITVELPNGSTTTMTSGNNFNFTQDGLHIFTPTNAGCQGPPLLVNAHAIPPIPDFITGPTDVCPGIPYVYEAGNDVDGTIYSWQVTDGMPATGVGKEITVTWNTTGTYLIEVQRINVQTPYCASAFEPLTVNPLTITPNISGPISVCANQSYTYSLDYLDGEEYKWDVDLEGQGSVITDPNSSSVDILWNNTTGAAVVTGSVRKCNVWYDLMLNVVIDPVNNVSFTVSDNLICQNETITINATGGYINYDWSISPMFGGSLPNSSSFSKTFTDAGTFIVTLVATDVCGNISTHSETITVLPEPPAVLSITANTLECTGGVVTSGSATLVTTIIGGIAGHTFDWTRNGGAFGSNMAIEPITNTGLYVVTVTNTATMCTTVLSINVQCPPGPTCTMPLANTGTFDFTYDNTTCGEVTFDETSVTTAAGWTFTSGTFKHNGVNAFSAPGPTYTYSSFNDAGYYNVAYELCFNHIVLGDCCRSVGLSVPIPVVAEAEANAFCDNTGTYMIQLDDFSSALGDLSGYNYEWYINAAMVGSGINQTSATTTIGLGGLIPGNTYPVLLKVFVPIGSVPGMTSDYECEYATTLVIPALPDATFTHNAPVCEDLDVEFIAALNSPNTSYDWGFGDGASLLQTVNTAARKYDGPIGGGYNVTLTVTNSAGCIDTYTDNVNVVSNDFDTPVIDVTPMTPICKPNPAILTFSHLGGATATSFDWSDGAMVNPNVVFDAGGYIVTVSDVFGCAAVSDLTPVDIRPSPNAFIFGESSYCYDADLPVRLFGYAGPGLTYEWRKRPYLGSWSAVFSTADNISDNSVFPSGSPYEYELTVKDPATMCESVTITTIDVHSPPPAPSISDNVVSCNPYTINLQANTGVSPAYFNWSNGATGSSINVMYGGLFEVTLTDDNGCTSTRDIDVQGEPNLDFFPVGCYEFCKKDMPWMFPGPYGNFDSWELFWNGGVIQSGIGPVANLEIMYDGVYYLQVTLNGCVFETGMLEVKFNDEKCEKFCDKKCEIKVGNINPQQIQDCLYEFNVDVFLGECTNIVDYQWSINNSPVPGGAVMSTVFANPGTTYYICVVVTGVDDFGNICKDKVCIKYTPTCECSCDIAADFDIIQNNCEVTVISTSTLSECTEIYQIFWTFSYNGQTEGPFYGSEFSNGFNLDVPVEMCLYVYGFDGTKKCKDKICKTIYPCNGAKDQSQDESSKRDVESPNIQINPNPVSDILRIQSTGSIGKEWHIRVMDVSGRLVSKNTIEVDSPLLLLSTDGWRNGMYQISISDELGNRFVHKVIKVD